jgi:D-alanine-D-alanine ligase
MEIPFVGADVLGSSVGMDKDISKRLVSQARVANAPFKVLRKGDPIDSKGLRFPLFVKPARMGSSVGITKIYDSSRLLSSVEKAFDFDEKILLEEGVEGREIQVSVIGNRDPRASLPCEIIPKGEFHTYESKYIDKDAADFLYPASLDSDEVQLIQALAIKIYQVLGCEGFARVDFFLTPQETFYFNEINTIPGLSETSPYVKMWQASGVSYGMVVGQLIRLALERRRQRSRISTSIQTLTPL